MCFSTLNANSAYGQCEFLENPLRQCRHAMPVKPIYRRKKYSWDFLENNSPFYLTTDTYSKQLKQEMCESFGCCFVQLNEIGDSYKCIMPSANHNVVTTKINSFRKVLS